MKSGVLDLQASQVTLVTVLQSDLMTKVKNEIIRVISF